MGGPQIKAIMMLILIFGGLAWYVTGGMDLSFPDMSSIKTLFTEKKGSSTTAVKRSASRSKVSAKRGQVIDSYRGVDVFYNGNVTNVSGRNTTKDGYNLGLKYQCVEFAKRFYFQAYRHKMPDSYGHAKDFFDRSLADGAYNKSRAMLQYKNGGSHTPKSDDLVIIGGSANNRFGHLFIITKVTSDAVEFIQQNPGAGNPSRGRFPLRRRGSSFVIDTPNVLGWLRIS